MLRLDRQKKIGENFFLQDEVEERNRTHNSIQTSTRIIKKIKKKLGRS